MTTKPIFAGFDIGYYYTKVVFSPKLQDSWPSAVGTPDVSRVRLAGPTESMVTIDGQSYLVGHDAVQKSRMLTRREDRSWIGTPEYRVLVASVLMHSPSEALSVVTGLPVAFLDDAPKLEKLYKDSPWQVSLREFHFADVTVIPQPFGALLDAALDWNGNVADLDVATGAVGVIDIGGKTTNILTAERLAELPAQTASVNVGGWDVVRGVRELLQHDLPDIADALRDHQLAEAIVRRKLRVFGEDVDLGAAIDSVVVPLAAQVLSQATQLWGSAAALSCVLLTGGGALLLKPYILPMWKHGRVVAEPVFANARGYYKYAAFLGKG